MSETKRSVTFLGNPLTLTGNDVTVGDHAPDFVVTSNDMKPVRLSDYKGKTVIISAVPSLDTPVCDTETRRFNAEASAFGPDVEVLTISMDLPFAQQRWCGAAGVDRVTTLSDYMAADFGEAYGVLINELKLLARTVFIVDKSGVIRYKQLVPEIAEEPNYNDILTALASI